MRLTPSPRTLAAIAFGFVLTLLSVGCNHEASPGESSQKLTAAQVQDLVKQAYIWGFPIVENYKAIYFYGGIDPTLRMYTPFNTVKPLNVFYDYTVTSVVSGNNDTFYSNGILDLRAEPIVFHVPKVAPDRYYTFQLASMTTDNFGYIGSRATGTGEGFYAVTGPSFTGTLPPNVKQIKSPSEFVSVIGRTAVYNKADAANAEKIQKEIQLIPLSKYDPSFKPKDVPKIDWPKYSPETEHQVDFFKQLNWLSGFIQFGPSEQEYIKKFEAIGVKPGQPYTFYDQHPEYQDAIKAGLKDGYDGVVKLSNSIGKTVNGWDLAPTDVPYYGNDYNLRAGWAMKAIYVNTPVEAYYPAANVDADGQPLLGTNMYTLHFDKGATPPAKYFWSITMYYADNKLMVKNPINRYSIGDRTPGLKYGKDGSLTIYLSHDKPAEGPSNWLPAPDRQWYVLMRIYGPKEDVLSGKWTPPAIQKAK